MTYSVAHVRACADQANESEADSDSMETGCAHFQSRHEIKPLSGLKTRMVNVVIAGAMIWILFSVVFDPPFAAYWMLVNGVIFILAAITNNCASSQGWALFDALTKIKRGIRGVTALALCANLIILVLLREFEIKNLAHYDPPSIPLHPESDIEFFQLYNHKLNYMDDIEAIHRHMNNQTSVTKRYQVDPHLNAWSADVLRYKFLLQFWRQHDQYRATHPGNRTKIVCLVESDVVFNEDHFANSLRRQQPVELAHAQHFWGHRTFEPFNIGILCTSSEASWWTRQWAWGMQALHSKRYRRLLYLDILYALVPRRLIFYWDEHYGCTEYYPHCHYIHFTRPKSDGIETAMEAIGKL